ncbi:hypothetical protein F4780DRAFT_774254 [Xylariomycetidae sp. FL0641]|nr:hypothetical protein F4780DRAFT_774254 [Xylariomycetidae sp. FL0641]
MAATLAALESQWHPGGQAAHRRLLHIPAQDNPTATATATATATGLPGGYARHVVRAPLVAFGALDARRRPWVSIWGGARGFVGPVARDVLGVRATVDVTSDPVVGGLFGRGEEAEVEDDKVVSPEGGRATAALAIDLESRDRVKLTGRMLAGAVKTTGPGPAVGHLQMAVQVAQSLGDRPKYLNRKRVRPAAPAPRLAASYVRRGASPPHSPAAAAAPPLPPAALDLLARADLIFVASAHAASDSPDVDHRGGSAGFVRVLHNDDDDDDDDDGTEAGGLVLVYPEHHRYYYYYSGSSSSSSSSSNQPYPGNHHPTRGNPAAADPPGGLRLGLAVPDWASGDVLYATGRATRLAGAAAAALLPGARRAVRLDVDAARFVAAGLPLRADPVPGGASPYHPPVRRLARELAAGGAAATTTTEEKGGGAAAAAQGTGVVARLVDRLVIAPRVARYTFALDGGGGKEEEENLRWRPGQHVTLDFAGALDDDDPASLNDDDYVRTFTVANAYAAPRRGKGEGELQLLRLDMVVARRSGPVTALLAGAGAPPVVEARVLGFGADGFSLLEPADRAKDKVFVAAGVGVTPLLAQARGLLRDEPQGCGGLRLLWSLRAGDLPLAVHVLRSVPGLADRARLFVTGGGDGGDDEEEVARAQLVQMVRGLGAHLVEARRMGPADVVGAGRHGQRKFFCCVGPGFRRDLLTWLGGEEEEEVVYESFEY